MSSTVIKGDVQAELARLREENAVLRRQAEAVAGANARAAELILEVEEAQEALCEARDEAQLANKLKSAFLATMSHEIRTPMNGVIGMVELLRGTELDEEQAEFLDVIQTSGDALLTIINDILDYSKIEAGHMTVESVPTAVAKTSREVVQLLQPAALGKGITLSLNVEECFPSLIESDPTRLRQVVANLVGNAIKFTAEGGVTVDLNLSKEAGEPRLVVSVQDSGIGMDAEVLSRLFEPFTQADSTTTRNFGGTGLGLAISKQLVEFLGGSLRVESTAGVGSRFYFDLPIKVCGREATPKGVSVAPQALEAHVLVAEDNQVNQLVVGRMLQRLGCTYDMVENGALAVSAVAESTYDAVLMDCHMPVLDGLAAAMEIKAAAVPGQAVPIIALTANVMPEDKQRCKEAGMDDFLAKPLLLAELRDMLVKVRRQAKGRSPRE